MSTSAATARAAAATARATPQATTFGALLRRSRLPGHAPKTVGRALAPQVYAAAAATTLDGAFAPAHDAHANVASAALVDFGLKRAVRASAGGARAATDAASVVAASQAATTVVNHHKSTAAPTIVVDELDSCHGHTRVRDASDRALRYKLAVENWSRASASTNASPSPSTSDMSSDGTASRTVSHSVASLGALDEQQFEEMLAVEVPRRRAEYDERLRAASENERLGAVASDSNEKKQEQIRKRLQLIRDVMQLRVDCVDGKMDGGDLATARRLDRGKTVGNDVDYPCTLAYHVPAVVDSSNGVENADATTATTATSDDKTATATPTTPLSPPLVKGRILNRVRDGYAVGVGGIVAFLPYPERSVVRNSGFNPDNRTFESDAISVCC